MAIVTGHIFGQRVLEGVLSSGAALEGEVEVVLVGGLSKDRRSGTVGYVDITEHSPIGARAMVISDPTLDSHIIDLEDAGVDDLFVVGWSRLVSSSVVTAFPSSIGMHPTRLPAGRGQAPIPWTIIKGLRESALSVFLLAEKEDAGPLLAQYPFEVRSRENATSLFHRIAQLHFLAGQDMAGRLARRDIEGFAQDDAVATRWPKRRPSDGALSTEMTREAADSLVRALRPPYPSAFVDIGGRRRDVIGTAFDRKPSEVDVIRFSFADGALELFLVPEEIGGKMEGKMNGDSRDISDQVRSDARVLWNYHHIDSTLPGTVDLVLIAGSHDERVALKGAELAKKYPSALIFTSGGFGKVTKDLQGEAEAVRFRAIMVDEGVPPAAIHVEAESSNMGENFTFTRRKVEELGVRVRTGIVVTKPYMERRAIATAMAQWPEVIWVVVSPEIEFENYPRHDVPEDRMIDLMVGDLQRVKVYGENGLQVPQEIPAEVWSAYERLVAAGFDRQVIR